MRIVWALVAFIFVSGLILPVWWLSGTVAPAAVPGLPSYPSAYIGDTVLIPAACLMLALGIKRLPPAVGERWVVGVSAVAASSAAVTVQAMWRADPDPPLNWTLTRPGHFSAPGWWHAAYFVMASAAVVGLIVLFLFRTRRVRYETRLGLPATIGGPGAAVVLTALGSYVGLVLHDNPGALDTQASSSTLILTVIALVAAIAAVVGAYGRSIVILTRPALLASGVTPAIVLLATTTDPLSPVYRAAGVVLICSIAVIVLEAYLVTTAEPEPVSFRAWAVVGASALVLVCTAGWVALWDPIRDNDLRATLIIGAAFFPLFTMVLVGMLGRRTPPALPVTSVALLLIIVTAAAVWHMADSSLLTDIPVLPIALGIAVGIVVGFAAVVAKVRTDGELGVPKDLDEPGSRLMPGRRSVRAGIAVALLAFLGLGAFLATLHFALTSTGELAVESPQRPGEVGSSLWSIYGAALMLAIALLVINSYYSKARITAVLNLVAPLSVSCVLAWRIVVEVSNQNVSTLAIGVGLVVAAWTFNSVINNSWLLQGHSAGLSAFLTSFSIGVLHGTLVMWVLTAGISDGLRIRSAWDAVSIAFTALVAAAVLVTILGAAEVAPRSHCTELPPWRGLMQDSLSCSAIVLFLVFPVVYFWEATSFWVGVATSAPIVTFFAFAFVWIVRANRNWPRVEARRVAEKYGIITSRSEADRILDELQGSWSEKLAIDQQNLRACWRSSYECGSPLYVRALVAHTRNQNRLAVIMLIVPIAGTLALIFQALVENEEFSGTLARIMTPR